MNFRLLLLPFSLIYAAISSARNFLFDKNIFTQTSFNKPVILVGNLSVGGTGKTPHVEYLVKLLHKTHRVATLSRGYGRKTNGFILGGKGATASLIGDEPMQYLSNFDDITVSVCEDRVEGARKLLALSPAPDVIVMDDGFQHRKINPGFKILLTPFDHPFTNDFLLPAGNLRENRSGYQRANCVIVTKCPDAISEVQKQQLTAAIKPVAGQELFFSSLSYSGLVSLNSYEILPLDDLPGIHVVLFTGIENPNPLISFLKPLCNSISCIKFPDHHNFTAKDIQQVIDKFDTFADKKRIILTTEKDYQRLKGSPELTLLIANPCYFIPLKVQIDRAEIFNNLIRKYVEQNQGNS